MLLSLIDSPNADATPRLLGLMLGRHNAVQSNSLQVLLGKGREG